MTSKTGTGFAGFAVVSPDDVAPRRRTTALPADALDALYDIHAANVGTASPWYAVPGDDEVAQARWLRALKAAAAELRATGGDGQELYPAGRAVLVSTTRSTGASVWALGGAKRPGRR